MPHFGLMDEDALGPIEGPLMRAKLHIRGGKRRLRQGKISNDNVTMLQQDLGGENDALVRYIARIKQAEELSLYHLAQQLRNISRIRYKWCKLILNYNPVEEGNMGKFSIKEVIEQAIQTEKLGYEFYTTMAKRFEKDEKLKRLFETLAVKELHHEKVFSDLKGKTGDEELANWEEASQYLRAIVESEFFLGKNKSLPPLGHVKTIADAVHFAIGFEKETLLYFHSLRDVIKEKEIVDEIVDEERSHIVWLSEFRRTVTS